MTEPLPGAWETARKMRAAGWSIIPLCGTETAVVGRMAQARRFAANQCRRRTVVTPDTAST
ncbi:MAG: hypothetical protein ABSE80_10945 [Halobacteriota archaeon]